MLSLSPSKPKQSKPKLAKCANKACRAPFEKRSMSHVACKVECAIAVTQAKREKALRLAAKIDRLATQMRREAIKTIPELKAEAQKAFNAFIRERDKYKPCICCGMWQGSFDPLTGGAWDAGHYRSTGSADHLRFDERNVHKQLKDCNKWGAGRAVDYRIGLIERIGREAVETLEADNAVIKWTREDLIAIKSKYRAKLKELQKQQEGV